MIPPAVPTFASHLRLPAFTRLNNKAVSFKMPNESYFFSIYGGSISYCQHILNFDQSRESQDGCVQSSPKTATSHSLKVSVPGTSAATWESPSCPTLPRDSACPLYSMALKSAMASEIFNCWGHTDSQLRQPMQALGCLSAGIAERAMGAIKPPPVNRCSL